MASDDDAAGAETFSLARIGTLRTPFASAFGCPRQGLAAPSVRGRIEMAPWVAAAASGGGGGFLEGLQEFSHVWVIFVFDQNRHSSASFDPGKSFLKPSVKPPWLVDADGRRGNHGVFATRSPHRPNPIGLTVCSLDYIDHVGAKVFVSGVDVVDGSAVLDLKPYHPIDSIPLQRMPGLAGTEQSMHAARSEDGVAASGSRDHSSIAPSAPSRLNGTGADKDGALPTAHFPTWLPAPRPRAAVRWSGAALEQLEALQPQCAFYPDARDDALPRECSAACFRSLRRAVEEVLGLDPRTPQSRCKGASRDETTHRYWALDFDALSIAFRLSAEEATAGHSGPVFEVVRVDLRAGRGLRSSKAWLETLRTDLETPAES